MTERRIISGRDCKAGRESKTVGDSRSGSDFKTERDSRLSSDFRTKGDSRSGSDFRTEGDSRSDREFRTARGMKSKREFRAGRVIFCILFLGMVLFLGQTPRIVQAATTLSSPASIKAVTSSYDSIKVSWSGVTGADGYRLYRAESKNGTYILIKTTTSKSYINTGLTAGKTYYYKVRAYKKASGKKVFGTYSAIKSGKPVPAIPGSVSATATSYDSVEISWDSVEGASGYRVYVATSSAGSYSLIKTTTAKSYRNTGLSTGSTYYYKVRAYTTVNGSKVFGSYAEIVNATPVLADLSAVTAAASDYGIIDLSWPALDGADGYEIERAVSDSQIFSLVSTAAAAEYSDADLIVETTYYYRIRAFRTVGSGRIYSNYSNVVNGIVHTIKVAAVSLSKLEETLILGNSDKLEALITPVNATNPAVTWQSSDHSIVTVDEEGNLTSVNAGTAVISVTTEDGGFTAECTVTVNQAAIDGIDVSKWQKTIDWAAVKGSGIEFAMIRASYGSSSVDPMFETNYQGAKTNGIAVGVYHYSYATTVAAATIEVKFLISKLSGKQLEYPVCVDVEDASQSKLDKKTITDIAITYLSELQKAGYYPMIYANKPWYTGKLDDSRLAVYDHWLAQWGSSITYTGPVSIWQYSSTGSVSGISGNVDLDRSFVDFASRIKNLGLNGF